MYMHTHSTKAELILIRFKLKFKVNHGSSNIT